MNKLMATSLTLLIAFSGAGCTQLNDTSFAGTGNRSSVLATAKKVGSVTVLLSDPITGEIDPSLQKTLTYQGVDDSGKITFGPVTLAFADKIELPRVPIETTGIEVLDPSDPSVKGEVEVAVTEGGTVFVTDVKLLPVRDGVAAVAAKAEDPVAVGAGFIQTKLSTLGAPGSSPVMAGVDASSYTSKLQHPFRTNSWISPVLWADNRTPYYIGNQKKIAYQQSIYPKPWNVRFETQSANDVDKGFRFGPERVRSSPGPNIPNPLGYGAPNQTAQWSQIQATFDVRPFVVRPGFLPLQMKVHRQGDYDAEFMMRAVDDPNFSQSGLPTGAALQANVVRGNPMLYFKAYSLPKVELFTYFFGEPTNQLGEVSLKPGVTVAYNVFTATYPQYGEIPIVVFYHKEAASLKTTTNLDPTVLTFNQANAVNYFSVCLLPDKSAATPTNIDRLARAAFAFPTDSTVTYKYNASSQTADATFKLQTTDVLNSGVARAVSGLLPNHYQVGPSGENVLLPGANDMSMKFTTVRGDLKVYDSDTFTCRYLYTGILPSLPPLDATDTAGLSKFTEWVSVFQRRHGSDSPPYTGINLEKGQQAYELGKFLGRNTLAANSIADVTPANVALSDQINDETRKVIELFFRQSPTYLDELKIKNDAAPYYLYYDPRVGAINQYPNATGPSAIFPSDKDQLPYESFGAVTRNNDHHFHYGYYIFAAGQYGLRHPLWAGQWKEAINQLIFDVAYDPSVSPTNPLKFPKMRNWDPYQGMCYAAGFSAPDDEGNNEESISEEVNFWAGVILWGAATNQQALLEHGITHYAACTHTSWTYFFDPAGITSALAKRTGVPGPTNWPGEGAVRLFDGFTRWDTFFGVHPGYSRAIVMIPFTGASFYHALNLTYAAQVMSDYDKNVKDFNIDPIKPQGQNVFDGLNQWIEGPAKFYALFAKYAALTDPDNAIARYWNVPSNYDVFGTQPNHLVVPNDKLTDVGDSGVFTYHFIRYLQTHGKPDPTVKATNTPFSMTFLDAANRRRTYAAFNHTAAAITATFSDGQSLTVPPGQTATKTVAF